MSTSIMEMDHRVSPFPFAYNITHFSFEARLAMLFFFSPIINKIVHFSYVVIIITHCFFVVSNLFTRTERCFNYVVETS